MSRDAAWPPADDSGFTHLTAGRAQRKSKPARKGINVTQTHRIRLRGPWNCQWLDPSGETSAAGTPSDRPGKPTGDSGRVNLPAGWQELVGRGVGCRLRLTRRFGRPTNLDADERVVLVFEDVVGLARIELNGQRLGEILPNQARAEFDVTSRLDENNRLTVEMSWDPSALPQETSRLWSEVALEIRSGLCL